MQTNMTFHAQTERAKRMEYIIDTVGIGDVIAEVPQKCDGRVRTEKLTSTGVIIVIGDDNRSILTAYICNFEKAIAVYKEAHHTRRMPDNLARRIKANRYYHENQPCA